mgnify:CR=1 FL=1
MMSMYESFVNLLTNYCRQVGYPIQIEKSLQDSSEDDSNAVKIFVSKYKDLNSISMDSIAHDVVRKIYFAGTTKEDESPASVDSFLIDSNGYWYFIEFKNQYISSKKVKEDCVKKSYANVFWLFKILDELQRKQLFSFDAYSSCTTEISPFEFVKKYCKFILVIGKDKVDNELNRIREAKKAKMTMPDSCRFLRKLESYVFKSADVYSADQFDREFVKKFRYS